MARKPSSRIPRPTGKYRKPPDPSSRGRFAGGLALGLAVAAGVHFYHAGPPGWAGGGPDRGAEAADGGEPPFEFDFYDYLPKKQVPVAEPPPAASTPAAAPQRTAAARPAPGRTAPDRPPAADAPAPAPAPAPATAAAEGVQYLLQAGSFRKMEEADKLRASLALAGYESRIRTTRHDGDEWHRVVLGPFRDRAAADETRDGLRASQGIEHTVLMREGS